MPATNKPRVIKDFSALDSHIRDRIKLSYPEGFEENLIRFSNKEGKYVSALPFETDDRIYLIRMSVAEAQEFIEENDDDYDDEGNLKNDMGDDYEEQYDTPEVDVQDEDA